jgi:branched-chain amino acid transport system permease protein/neutral amino acid transport system permease protein
VGFSENLGMWAVSRTLGVPTAYKPLIPYIAIVAVLLYRYRMRFRGVFEA